MGIFSADIFSAIGNFFGSAFFQLLIRVTVLFLVFFWFSLVYWTFRDAKKRGALAVYWAVVVLFFNLFGWFIYLIVRPPEYEEDARERELEIRAKEALLGKSGQVCPGCLKSIESDFLVCPYCLKKLRKPCSKCKHPLDMNWTVCPYCRATVS